MTEEEHTLAIARLNDQHRARSGVGWVMTPGVQSLAPWRWCRRWPP